MQIVSGLLDCSEDSQVGVRRRGEWQHSRSQCLERTGGNGPSPELTSDGGTMNTTMRLVSLEPTRSRAVPLCGQRVENVGWGFEHTYGPEALHAQKQQALMLSSVEDFVPLRAHKRRTDCAFACCSRLISTITTPITTRYASFEIPRHSIEHEHE